MTVVVDAPYQHGGAITAGKVEVELMGLGSGVHGWKHAAKTPPLFIETEEPADWTLDDFLSWTEHSRDRLDALILEHGGIVLRGFPMATPSEFSRFAAIFPPYKAGYVGGKSPRKKVAEGVLESTRLAENYKIILHSEMAYMKRYPPRIAFFCRQMAEEGGETIIGSMHEFMDLLPVDLREKLVQHRVRVIRNFAPRGNTARAVVVDHPEKIGWDDAFFTQSEAQVDAHCLALGIQSIWNDDGSLTLIEEMDAVTPHPITGKLFYRNNLHTNENWNTPETAAMTAEIRGGQKYPSGIFLEDGSTLTPEEVSKIKQIWARIELAWRWRNGDIMILDNLQVAHGRNPFSGPREVLVALFA